MSRERLSMDLGYLADHPGFVAELSAELLAFYRNDIPEDTLADRVAKFERHMNRDVLPIAWVAYRGDSLLGTAALRPRDLDGWNHLTPWLGGVYVLPAHRRNGVGAALCGRVEDEARGRGYDQIFLFTRDRQSWYRSMGWALLAETTW